MKIRNDIESMSVTVSANEFSRILALASNYAKVCEDLGHAQDKIARMRKQLTDYQRICEKRKSSSGVGASVEPQTNEQRDSETFAVLSHIENEGRVSGGERAHSYETGA